MLFGAAMPLGVAVLLLLCMLSGAANVRTMLGTRSPYPEPPDSPSAPLPDACVPEFLYLLGRHGSRYPTLKVIKKAQKLAKVLATLRPTNPDLQWLTDWECPYDTQDEGQLSAVGELEWYRIGQRLRRRFPAVFAAEYRSYRFPIHTTKKPRAAQTGTAFGYGVWEGQGPLGPHGYLPLYQYSRDLESDKVLYPHKYCRAYKARTKLANCTREADLFGARRAGDIRSHVHAALGVADSGLGLEDIHLLFDLCGFQLAVRNATGGFCDLFASPELLDVMEYWNDLKVLGKKLYGDEPGDALNFQIGAETLRDLMDSLEAAVAGESPVKAALKFAHAETVAPLLGLLGLFKDEAVLRHDSPAAVVAGRAFRASVALPFSANVVFVLHDCGGARKVQVLHNEVEVPQPWCGGARLCPWEAFKAAHAATLQLNYSDLCDLRVPTTRAGVALDGTAQWLP